MRSPTASDEVARRERFAFGENWAQFLSVIGEDRVSAAEKSLQHLLKRSKLDGVRLLDVGCGSGLYSLAARRLGAAVHSFDYDPNSVACTLELRRRFTPDDAAWLVEEGSVLDDSFLDSLGTFDVVYSWGVLHHTGAMWRAVDNASRLVAPLGMLAIAIYNRQPILTPFWVGVKRLYLVLPLPVRPLLTWGYLGYAGLASAAADMLKGRVPWGRWRLHGDRGMSLYHDAVDWVGGWPFEAASPGEVVAFLSARGFELVSSATVGHRHGCNEFLFRRQADLARSPA